MAAGRVLLYVTGSKGTGEEPHGESVCGGGIRRGAVRRGSSRRGAARRGGSRRGGIRGGKACGRGARGGRFAGRAAFGRKDAQKTQIQQQHRQRAERAGEQKPVPKEPFPHLCREILRGKAVQISARRFPRRADHPHALLEGNAGLLVFQIAHGFSDARLENFPVARRAVQISACLAEIRFPQTFFHSAPPFRRMRRSLIPAAPDWPIRVFLRRSSRPARAFRRSRG